MTNEIWRDVVGFEGLYRISSSGRVMNKRDKILKTFAQGEYDGVHLMKSGKRYNKKIHRLVAEAFLDNPEGKREVDHINTIKNDNRVENLRWVTPKENMNNSLTRKNLSVGIGKKLFV